MTFRTFFGQWFRLLLAIHGFIGILAGYWDMRLSDAFLYGGQMARIHYIRTLQSHLVLAVASSLALAFYLARWHWRRTQDLDRERVIPAQLALAVSYLAFLVVGIKLHLVWLNSHLQDPEGLLWTGLLLVAVILLYLVVRLLTSRIYRLRAGPRIASIAFILLAAGTGADAYFNQTGTHRAWARPGSPGVLLIVADTLRWDHVSAYKYPRSTTPNLDQLAREGALYEQAFSASPWTTPSHAAMFTGQYPSRNGVDGRNIFLNPDVTTLAGFLTQRGYQTAGFINNVYIRRQTGIGRGFQQYEEFWGRNEGSSLPQLVELLKNRLQPRTDTGAHETRKAVDLWLEEDWNARNPFFLFVHFMEPHAPYGTAAVSQFLPASVGFDEARKVNQDPEEYICGKLQMTSRDFEMLNALYDSDIRYLDQEIGAMLNSFRKRGLLDNTLVIFVSDHGEHFGDHGLMSHELSIYDSLIRVPLMVRHPATIPAGTRAAGVVQTVDLFPSILKFLNVAAGSVELQGAGFLPPGTDRTDRPFAFAEYNNARAIDKVERRFPGFSSPVCRRKTLKAVRSADLKLIIGDDGTRELYDMRNDPGETRNLHNDAPDEARILEDVLNKWSASFAASRYYRQEKVSKEAMEELKALGYVQ